MKTKITFIILLMSCFCFAQNGINYKAVIKDNLGNVVANQNIDIQFKILKGISQTNVYQETHSPTTDANGMVIVNIGEGTTSDIFTDIDWASDDHFLNVQVDIGSGLVDLGTTQFMGVPYAMTALDNVWKKSGSFIYNENENVAIGTNNSPLGKMEIRHNSTISSPQITLYEDELDYARLGFRNSEGSNYWHVAATLNTDVNFDRLNFYNSRAGDVMSLIGNGRVGIGVWDANQKLDVNGKLKIGDDAAPPSEGTMRYNNTNKTFEGFDGTDWVVLNGTSNAVVTFPKYLDINYSDFSIISGGRVRIVIEFNIQMDPSSFVIGNSLTASGTGGQATGTLQWTHGNTRLVFTSNEAFTTVAPCFSGGMTLTIKGSGPNIVLDTNGKPIDGDKDGKSGGDFVVTFDIAC